MSEKLGVRLKEAYINGIPTSFDAKLKNGSIVAIKCGNDICVKEEWINWVNSNYARIKIKEELEKKEN